ncbi:MAG TPA: LysR family transcriptional regulator [Gemmatimonadaceae bacterium]|nr:LysR family transcriptional regulator [Gemmatimonadaceae bacterium]
MNIHDLEAFIAVVETGSIGAAALRLNLTQPGVTRRVQSLEHTLGTPLLDRRSKPPRITTAGRAAYDQARRVTLAVRDMTLALEPDGEPRGEFRIGVSVGLGDLALFDPVDRVRAAFPHLLLRASTGSQTAQQVRAGTLDAAAFLSTDTVDPPYGLAGERLCLAPAVIVAGSTFPLSDPERFEDLAAVPWVLNHDGCAFRRALTDAFTAHRRVMVPGVEAGGNELHLSLIARGHGIGMVLPRMLERSAFRDAVRVVPVDDFHPMFAVWLVHSAYPGRLAAPIRCFRDALAAQLS